MPNATSPSKRRPYTDQTEVARMYEALRGSEARLTGQNGEARSLPDSLPRFLTELTQLLNTERFVAIVRNQATFTTIEAASLLGVSRQFLVNLLEGGEIPYHTVGTHRRVYAEDLFRYKARRDSNRHRAIRELAQAEAAEGLYDRKPAASDGR